LACHANILRVLTAALPVFRNGPYHQQMSYQLYAAATRTPAEERDETVAGQDRSALVTTGVFTLATITANVRRTADLMFGVGMISK